MTAADGDSGVEETASPDGTVDTYEGVTYAQRDAGAMKLDLFVPETDAPPLVVYVHGGGWAYETRANAPDLERYAAEWGYAFASVSYRLVPIPADSPFDRAPENPTPRDVFPAQIRDVMAAIRWLAAHADEYGFDASRTAAWGSSAGGHLAALAGTLGDISGLAGDILPPESLEKTVAPDHSGEVQAVIDWYGVSDLRGLDADGFESLLLDSDVADTAEMARLASPVTHVSPEAPPFLLMAGQADELVPFEQTRKLADALERNRVDTTVYALHDLGHAFDADSERTAMESLAATPRPGQSVTATAHFPPGDDGGLEGVPPAGPDAIEAFLDRTIGSENSE